MAQPVLHRQQHGACVGGFDIDHPVGVQPHGGQRRGEEIPCRETPENRPAGAGQDGGGENRGGGEIGGRGPGGRDLVQGAAGEPAPGQCGIERGQPEGQGGLRFGCGRGIMPPGAHVLVLFRNRARVNRHPRTTRAAWRRIVGEGVYKDTLIC